MTSRNQNIFIRVLTLLLAGMAVLAGTASAQLPIPASTQFDITGFIQDATLDPTCAANAHCGGTITVNGHIVTVPKETIVIFPANALTWQEIFAQAPPPYGFLTAPPSSGLALSDAPAPMTTYEAQVVGNRILGAAPNEYIAGLIYISQHALNSGAGFINFINYATGEMRVGGNLGDSTTGARVQINDPSGRFGRVVSPDVRFTVDPDNPTIAATSGFPMCIPRVALDPTVAGNPDDALCPQLNRPAAIPPAVGYAAQIQMTNPILGAFPSALQQAPFEIGDFITFAGTVVHDGASPTAGPWPGTAGTYISAHTISNNILITTWPGTNPAYVALEVTILGTGGLTVLGADEAVARTRFEGMTTDPSRKIHLYGIDFAPVTGTPTDRDWGTIGADPGPNAGGAVTGRWRFRPPCAPFGTVPAKPDKQCVMNQAGTFLPATREVRAVIEGAWVPGQATTFANGIIAGQYHAPILELIFPENVPGTPIVENNFNTIPFLAAGGYSSSAGTVAAVLNPWPSSVPPPPPCIGGLIVPNTGGPYTMASGGTIVLNGSATGASGGPYSFTWSVGLGSLSSLTIANPFYTAPVVAAQTVVPATLTVSAANCPNASANTTITINASTAPTVSIVPNQPQTVISGTPVSFTASCTDSNVPPATPCTFLWTQTNAGTPGVPTVLNPNPNPNATISFTPTLPPGATVGAIIQLQAVARNTFGLNSAPALTAVTVNPQPDQILITSAEYRVSKQRLIINATSNVVSPNVVLKLQPYLTTTGSTYNPDPAAGGVGNTFTNNGGGLYLIDLVGAPEPACGNPAGNQTPCPATPMTVKSNLNGNSGPFGLTRIR